MGVESWVRRLFWAGVAKTLDAGMSDGPTAGQLIPPLTFAGHGCWANQVFFVPIDAFMDESDLGRAVALFRVGLGLPRLVVSRVN